MRVSTAAACPGAGRRPRQRGGSSTLCPSPECGPHRATCWPLGPELLQSSRQASGRITGAYRRAVSWGPSVHPSAARQQCTAALALSTTSGAGHIGERCCH